MRRTALLALCLLSGLLVAGTLGPSPSTGDSGPPAVIADWEGVSTGVGNDANTQLLLHFEADASTAWSDSSLAAHSQPTVSSATRSEVQEKFGDSSALFVSASSKYLEWAAHEDWQFGAGDWTVDCWIRPASFPAAGSSVNVAAHYVDSQNYTTFQIENNGGTYYLRVRGRDANVVNVDISEVAAMSADTWYHAEWARSGTTYYLFLDGTLLGSTVDADSVTSSDGVLRLGTSNPTFAHYDGYLDEFRLTKGEARHTATFTAPTAKYGGLTLWLEDSEGNKYPAQGWVP